MIADHIKLIHGDCMDVMATYPDKYFDLAIVDPPYGIGFDGQKESTSKHGGRKAYTFKGWDSQTPKKEYFEQLFRVSKNQIIFGANYFTKNLPSSMGWIVWDKGQRICNSDGELAFSSFDRALRIFTLNRCKIQLNGGAIHPTQKPTVLYDWIYKNYAEKGQKILDTHLGSGSNAISAFYFGVGEFVGVEIDKEYFDAAYKRINEQTNQLTLF